MKVYQRSNKPNEIRFINYDRIDDEIVFHNAMEILKSNETIVIGKINVKLAT